MVGTFHLMYLLNIEKRTLQNINDITGNEFNLLNPGMEMKVM